MRLALCWLVLSPLLLVAARSAVSADEVSPRPRRAFRELSKTALDALTTLDLASEGFLDPAVEDGALKAILVPRVGVSGLPTDGRRPMRSSPRLTPSTSLCFLSRYGRQVSRAMLKLAVELLITRD
jgi:hypothetical protein